MSRTENRNRAQKTAAWLKIHSPVRLTSRCPVCYGTYKIGGHGLENHFATSCKKGSRK